ncbi:MAG: hypothetical protein KC731_29420, partial [Myxococcales bacterium]|nr:hypothetical protein [Myxococcales bacterium]
MRKGRRWVAVLAVLAFAAPIFGMGVDAAQAAPTTTTTTGAVHAALQGPTIDPYGPVLATSLRIQPPKGALVMVYRDGKPIGMYSQAAFLPAQDDAVYGVVAFRGQTVLFKGNVVARPGVTELLWGAGRTPTILFHPAPRPVQGTVIHHVHHDGASGAAFLPGAGLVTTSPTTPVAVPYAGDAPAMPEA